MSADPVTLFTRGIEKILRELLPSKWAIEHVPAQLTLTEFKRLLNVTPFIGIAWSKTDIGDGAGRSPILGMTALLTFCVRNVSRTARFMSDDAGPGLYSSMEASRILLHGRSIEEIGTVTVTACSQAYADGYGEMDIAVGLMTVQASTIASRADSVADLPDFARLATTWDFDQGSNGPADNLTDVIEVETET